MSAVSEFPPCCVRFWPADERWVVVGTYNLVEGAQRDGSVEVYAVSETKELEPKHNVRTQSAVLELKLKHSVRTQSAVLDLKFNPFDDTMFVTAHSRGDLTVWRVSGHAEIVPVHHQRLFEPDVLVTAVVFSNTVENRLLLTTTDGYVSVVELHSGAFSEPRYLDTMHDLQCWTAAFGELGELSSVVFSGGDDGKLIAHDLRSNEQIFQNNRIHKAGVVAIQTSTLGDAHGRHSWKATDPYALWTGSYDDCLRILDLRCVPGTGLVSGIPPRVLKETNLGGGVWRFASDGQQDKLVTCCMYDGARILDSQGEVVKTFHGEHKSMVYGCDFSSSSRTVATCSFYDKVVHLWEG